jgi:hypothetical protein
MSDKSKIFNQEEACFATLKTESIFNVSDLKLFCIKYLPIKTQQLSKRTTN